MLVDAPHAVLGQPTSFPVGQGAAQLASVLSLLPVPVVSVVVGIAAGPLGLAALQADRVLMQANAVMCTTMVETPALTFGRRRGGDEFGVVAPAHECLRLGIADADVHAVSVAVGADGRFASYDESSPMTTSDGKRTLVESLGLPRRLVAVGDGATDLAIRPVADAFAAFIGFVRREPVVAGADAVVHTFDQLAELVLA